MLSWSRNLHIEGSYVGEVEAPAFGMNVGLRRCLFVGGEGCLDVIVSPALIDRGSGRGSVELWRRVGHVQPAGLAQGRGGPDAARAEGLAIAMPAQLSLVMRLPLARRTRPFSSVRGPPLVETKERSKGMATRGGWAIWPRRVPSTALRRETWSRPWAQKPLQRATVSARLPGGRPMHFSEQHKSFASTSQSFRYRRCHRNKGGLFDQQAIEGSLFWVEVRLPQGEDEFRRHSLYGDNCLIPSLQAFELGDRQKRHVVAAMVADRDRFLKGGVPDAGSIPLQVV